MAAPPGDWLAIDFETPLAPPAGGSVALDFPGSPAPPTRVGLGDTSKFGAPSIRLSRLLRAVGWQDSAFPIWPYKTPTIERDGQKVFPSAWVDGTVSSPTYVRWRRYIYPLGFTDFGYWIEQVPLIRARYFGGYIAPPGGPNLILNFSDLFVYQPGGSAVLEFGAFGAGTILGATLGQQGGFGTAVLTQSWQVLPPSIVNPSPFGALKVEGNIRYIQLSDGIYMSSFGVPTAIKTAVAILAPGIAPPSQTEPLNGNRPVPNPVIYNLTQILTGAGSINTFALPNTHILSHWIQYLNHSTYGVPPPGVGTPELTPQHREIFPLYITGPYWGTAAVKRQFFVDPVGWDSSFVSQPDELLVNVRRVHVHTGLADPAEYGIANVFNWRQDINLHNNGWYDTQWNFPVVYNLTQIVFVGPFEDNVDPDTWPNYYPFVNNVDRELRTFGHQSSRLGISAWIYNTADPVFPVGTDLTLWGTDTSVTHRIRTVFTGGWEEFYNSIYNTVWNAAVAIGPVSAGNASALGRPDPVANLNRTVKHHSGWDGPEWGVPFIDFALRYITPSFFKDVPAAFPEVRFNPFPIASVGVPESERFGGHEVRIFRRVAFPKSTNVHDPWFGEPIVANRNRSVWLYGLDHSDFGVAAVQNFVRYISPEWSSPYYFTPPAIMFRTRTVYPVTISIPTFPVLHRIRNDMPDPPSPQRIFLNVVLSNGEEGDGFGIPPPGVPWPAFKLFTIYPVAIDETARFGTHKVHTNNITPRFIFEDRLFGTPALVYTIQVYPPGLGGASSVSNLSRLTPWNIYAPLGDQKPPGYTPGPPNGYPHVIQSETVFGAPAVTNQHRTIGPVPTRVYGSAPWFDSFPMFGTATLTVRPHYVFMTGIKSLRFGQVVLWGVPQYVYLEDEMSHYGIANTQHWGANKVSFPPEPPSMLKNVYPVGMLTQAIPTAHRIELFNRQIFPVGVPHSGNPQQGFTSPWGVPMMGYTRTYTAGMGVQTRWGNNLIEFLHRPVYPFGWNNSSLEDGNLDNYRFPMKFVRKNPPVRPVSVPSTVVFGISTVTQRVRVVYSRGIDSYNSGSYCVKASSTVGPQGWESLLVGDIDRWEAGKVKAHGDDMGVVGIHRLLHPLRPSGFDTGAVTGPSVAPRVSPVGIPDTAFDGPSVTNPFGCTNRVVTPLPVLPTHIVSSPTVT